jgi:hypothetical protein
MQLADILATNSRLGYFTLQALLDTHSYNKDPSAELAAATSVFTIRITGNRLSFNGLESLQMLLAESHTHASLDLRLTYNKVVQQIVHVSSFSFVHPGYNWSESASSIISSHMEHGLQSITYAQLVDLLDSLQHFDSVFCSIESAYADHSNIHAAALTTIAPPTPLEAQVAALTALVSKPTPLEAQVAALTALVAKLAVAPAAPTAAPARPPRYGRGGYGKGSPGRPASHAHATPVPGRGTSDSRSPQFPCWDPSWQILRSTRLPVLQLRRRQPQRHHLRRLRHHRQHILPALQKVNRRLPPRRLHQGLPQVRRTHRRGAHLISPGL